MEHVRAENLSKGGCDFCIICLDEASFQYPIFAESEVGLHGGQKLRLEVCNDHPWQI